MTIDSGCTLKVLVVADIHLREAKLEALAEVVSDERPDLITLNGDILDVGQTYRRQVTSTVCAGMLSAMPVRDSIFTRGNHEDENWLEFLAAWPLETRPLTVLHGSSAQMGPLSIIGFPCLIGNAAPFEMSLPAINGDESPSFLEDPAQTDTWLPGVIRRLGPSSRALWLMHEPPSGTPLSERCGPISGNPEWLEAIDRFSPRLVICAHDHLTPLKNRRWHHRIQETVCVNVGQGDEDQLHYSVVDLEFRQRTPCLPSKMEVRAYPWAESVSVIPNSNP